MNNDTCIFPLCTRPIERDEFCVSHAVHFAGPKPPKVRKPIAKQSDKRKAEQPKYRKMVIAAVKENNECMIKSPNCTGIMEGLDHRQKRSPGNFLDKNNQVPACNACNLFKELHPGWASENGHSVSRFTPLIIFEEINGVKVIVADRI